MLESDKNTAKVNPYLVVADLNAAAEYYLKAFGARQAERYADPSGKVWYSVFKVFGTPLQIMEPDAEMGLVANEPGTQWDSTAVHLTVPNVAAAHKRAVAAGGTSLAEPQAEGRARVAPPAQLRDPFGFRWILGAGNPSASRTTPALAPVLVVNDVEETSGFWKSVFGAKDSPMTEEQAKTLGPVTPLRLGNAAVHLRATDTDAGLVAAPAGGHPKGDSSMVTVSVDDVDSTFESATSKGATEIVAPQDAYWGDRYAEFRDVSSLRVACCGGTTLAEEVSDPAELQKKLDNFLTINDNPSSPATAVGVENVNAG